MLTLDEPFTIEDLLKGVECEACSEPINYGIDNNVIWITPHFCSSIE